MHRHPQYTQCTCTSIQWPQMHNAHTDVQIMWEWFGLAMQSLLQRPADREQEAKLTKGRMSIPPHQSQADKGFYLQVIWGVHTHRAGCSSASDSVSLVCCEASSAEHLHSAGGGGGGGGGGGVCVCVCVCVCVRERESVGA